MDFKIMNKLFVYGTLKRQHSRNSILSAASFIQEIQTLPLYTMINLGAFPGILDTGGSVIYGEVYEVDDSILEICDVIEGHPSFYKRKLVKLDKGMKAEAYFLPKAHYNTYPVIESGIWK
jgi:gamma-glutamylaminecyclotransferase